MRLALPLLLLACSKPAPCPTVDDILRDEDGTSDRREYEIVIDRCRADGWSAAVINCLRDAKTALEQEPCFGKLSLDQQQRLAAAFEPIEREYRDNDRAELRDLDAKFGRELEAQRATELATRAPACQSYLDALTKERQAVLACKEPSALVMYGSQQAALTRLRELQAIADPQQLASACDRAAKAITGRDPCK